MFASVHDRAADHARSWCIDLIFQKDRLLVVDEMRLPIRVDKGRLYPGWILSAQRYANEALMGFTTMPRSQAGSLSG
jgi:hypothetical protein